MPSSTSNSEKHNRVRLDRFTITLLATVLVAMVSVEAVTRIAFDRTSKVQIREVAQRNTLFAVRDLAGVDDPHVAVLGNSLMLNGVEVPHLMEKLEPTYTPVPYFVLGTEYYDWFYALKRLFAEGVRPRYVVLGLSPNQLASTYTRGDYSARYLFRAADLPTVARQTHMDLTTASGFVLAHFSEAYSTREATRGFLMGRLLPQVGELLHSRLGTTRAADLDQITLRRIASERVPALDHLCRANGARFFLVIPPSNQKGEEIIQQVGRENGIPVLVPVPSQEFDTTDYGADGFHMNEKGARIFTSRLAENLLEMLREDKFSRLQP
jgi:hypothetical protein